MFGSSSRFVLWSFWYFLLQLGKVMRNVRTFGITDKNGTGDLQDTKHTALLLHYNTVEYNTVQYSTVQYSTIQYGTL